MGVSALKLDRSSLATVAYDLPQDPLLPQKAPIQPSFLDTGACLCELNGGPGPELAWRCAGNQTDMEAASPRRSGKWFITAFNKTESHRLALPPNDDSTPPITDRSYRYDTGSVRLVDGEEGLSVYDRACTGRNHTTFSTSWYRAAAQMEKGERPVDAAPCWRPDTLPSQIQTVEEWLDHGCSPGFLCVNNTVNSLPQFCPPVTECQLSRLFGSACLNPFVEGENMGMGPFEPVVCPTGRYCPPEQNGTVMILCPAKTYCQPGSASPTPCSTGSRCPPGSSYETYLAPLGIVIIFDLLLAVLVLALGFRGRILGKLHAPLSPRTSATSSTYTIRPEKGDFWNDDAATVTSSTVASEAFVKSVNKATESVGRVGLSFSYASLTFRPRGLDKPVLQNVSGSIRKGSMTAVMGGSGAGKSTLVKLLMGRLSPSSGTVTVNEVPGSASRFRKMVGYVPQDDIVSTDLTVRENILHSARIRLPRRWSETEIQEHVDVVINCLELGQVQNSLVGTVDKPVISGGQRKRVSIGMELAAAPMAIFLDEPTSGLDATAASSMMATLRALSRLGITVITAIHQPRREIFDMIDDLILLASGNLIYHGAGASAKAFFEAQGFRFPHHANSGDVLTDIITGNGRPYKTSGDVSHLSLVGSWEGQTSPKSVIAVSRSSTAAESSVGSSASRTTLPVLGKQHAPFLRQVQYNLSRAFLQQSRTKMTLVYELILASLAGFLLGLAESPKKGILFTGLYKGPYEVLSVSSDFKSAPEMALLTAIAIGLVSAAPGVKVFSEEMTLHHREAEAGHSRLAYFIAKSLAVTPRMALACLHFTTPLMLMAVPIIPYWSAFLVNLLYFYCIFGLASCVSVVVQRADAPLFGTMLALIVGILSGAAPPMRSVANWHMEWLWRSSPGVWLAEYYFGQLVLPFRDVYNVDLASDLVGFHLEWRWQNLCVLAGIGTVYRLLAFGGLVLGTVRSGR